MVILFCFGGGAQLGGAVTIAHHNEKKRVWVELEEYITQQPANQLRLAYRLEEKLRVYVPSSFASYVALVYTWDLYGMWGNDKGLWFDE